MIEVGARAARMLNALRQVAQIMIWIALPALGMLGIFLYGNQSLKVIARNAVFQSAVRLSDSVDRSLFERGVNAEIFALNGRARDRANWRRPAPGNPLVEAMNGYVQKYGFYKMMILTDLNGMVLAVNSTAPGGQPIDTRFIYDLDFSGAVWLRGARNLRTGSVMGEPETVEPVRRVYGGDGFVITFAAPVMDAAGQPIGVWVDFVDFGFVESIVAETYRALWALGYASADVTILRRNGSALVDYDPRKMTGTTYVRDLRALRNLNPLRQGSPSAREARVGRSGTLDERTEGSGDSVVTAYLRSQGALGRPGTGWLYIITVDEAEAYAAIDLVRNMMTEVLVVTLLASLAAVIWWTIKRRDLDEVRARLSAIVESSTDAIVSKSLDGLVASWNYSSEKLFGYTADEIIGKPMALLIPPGRAHEEPEILTRVASGKRIDDFETVRIAKGGRLVDVSATIFPIRDGKGQITAISSIVHDITERKKIDRLKSEFISTVSHELRTPLTSIKGSLGLIRYGAAGTLPAQFAKMLDIAYKNSERLIRLINDILDIEKLTSGKMEFRTAPLDAGTLLENAIEANKGFGAEYGIRFVLTETVRNICVVADGDRLMQVLANLMSNAAKFSPSGSEVHIGARLRGDKIRISVRDHGPGIPAEFQARIFGRFAQADSSDTRPRNGTGLGLSIAKAIVEGHGGTIGFETETGNGTTFYFDLPCRADAKPPSDLPREDASRPRVLICEDDLPTVAALRDMLGEQGIDSDVALNAGQAKELLSRYRYDAMMLNMGLPDQDGVSLIVELRGNAQTRSLPILIVTAKKDESSRNWRGNAIHVVDWLHKPVDKDRLLEGLRRIMKPSSQRMPEILHVEDEPDVIQIVRSLVQGLAALVPARNLKEAKRLLRDREFDLVVLDLMLPDGDGEELLPLLCAPGKPPIPAIIFSAKDPSAADAQCIHATLLKSQTSNETLLSAIRSIIGPRTIAAAETASGP